MMVKKKEEPNKIEVQTGNVDVLIVSLLNSINKNLAILLEEIRGRSRK